MAHGLSPFDALILSLLLSSAIVGSGLLLLTLGVADACYISPCEQGDGLTMLFTVDPSRSFDGASTALAFIAHGAYGARLLLRRDECSDVAVGTLVGSTLLLLLMAAQSVVRWGQLSLLISQLATHGLFHEPAGGGATRVSRARVSEEPAFLEMTFLAAVEAGLLLALFASLAWGADGERSRFLFLGVDRAEPTFAERAGLLAAGDSDDEDARL